MDGGTYVSCVDKGGFKLVGGATNNQKRGEKIGQDTKIRAVQPSQCATLSKTTFWSSDCIYSWLNQISATSLLRMRSTANGQAYTRETVKRASIWQPNWQCSLVPNVGSPIIFMLSLHYSQHLRNTSLFGCYLSARNTVRTVRPESRIPSGTTLARGGKSTAFSSVKNYYKTQE